jgi:hypothetical protein
MTLPYGVDAATGRFTTSVGIGAADPSSGLYVLGNMRIDTGGTVIAEDSEVRVTTTTDARGITFQTGRRQKTAARWELVSAQSGPDPVAFTGLDGNADVMYLLVYEVRADGGVEWGLQYNSDTGNNYEMIDINTTGAGAINSDDTGGTGLIRIPAQFVQASGDFYSGELKIFAQSGRRRALINHMLRGDGGNSSLEWASGAGWWTNTASNLTRIDIIGNFSAASDFRLYRRIR